MWLVLGSGEGRPVVLDDRPGASLRVARHRSDVSCSVAQTSSI
jgi:hypothetical protein